MDINWGQLALTVLAVAIAVIAINHIQKYTITMGDGHTGTIDVGYSSAA
jgi:hypothetical protein